MKIEKKTWPEYFREIKSGKKNFDLRLNDFAVKEGDVLVLREWDPNTGQYTGQVIEKTVGYAAKFKLDGMFWPRKELEDKGIVVMALRD